MKAPETKADLMRKDSIPAAIVLRAGKQAAVCTYTNLLRRKERRNLHPRSLASKCQGRERNPNTNFLVRISSGGVVVFHMKGWGPKSSVCPSKQKNKKKQKIKPNFLAGYPGIVAGISLGCPKSLRKQSVCSILIP